MGNKLKNSNNRKSKQAEKKNKRRKNQHLRLGTWEQLLRTKINKVEFPGGKHRKTYCLHLFNGSKVIATERPNHQHLEVEISVLKTIGEKGGNVPKLITTDNHHLLVQQYIDGVRLSQALQTTDSNRIQQLLSNALSSLAAIHKIGSDNNLDQLLPGIGQKKQWIIDLLNRPAIIGQHLGIPAPQPQLGEILTLFSVNTPRFIKWDARPGNAMVRGDHQVAWFDWEHAGTRHRLDDMVWLLGDEFVPNLPDIETQLVDEYITEFADQFDDLMARQYFYAFGVFHSTVRLGLILSNKENKSWWDFQYCLDGDKVGVTLELAQRLCIRASRWAQYSEMTNNLAPWYLNIAEKLEEL